MSNRIEGYISREDYEEAQLYLSKKISKIIKKRKYRFISFWPMVALGVFIGIGIGFLKHKTGINFHFDTTTAIIIGSVIISLNYIMRKRFKSGVRDLPSKDSIVLGRHIYEIKEDGFWTETDKSSSLVNWDGILSVEETLNMVFVFIDTAHAFFIPKRFFDSDGQSEDFINNVRSHIKATD